MMQQQETGQLGMTLERVVVINDLSQAKGGATGLALLSARALAARGLDVTYICGDAGHTDQTGAAHVVAAGSAQLLKRNPLHAARRGLYNPETRDLLARFIAETDTPGTVYHLHGWAQILSPSVFEALAPVASRCFIHAHDMFLACPNGVYMDYPHDQVCAHTPLGRSCLATNCDKRSYLHKGWRVLRQRAVQKAFDLSLPWAGILAIHPDMVARLARAGYAQDLFHVVRNPAEPFSIPRIPAEKNHRFAYVGRLEADKGALDLAQSAARIGADVTFVGDGVLRAQLEQEFPQFRITGWQDREAIGAFLQDAHALVMPSRHPEPFALVLPEAILSGLGVSFDVFDPKATDAALTRLAAMDERQVREMSERGHAASGTLARTSETWINALMAQYERALSALRSAGTTPVQDHCVPAQHP